MHGSKTMSNTVDQTISKLFHAGDKLRKAVVFNQPLDISGTSSQSCKNSSNRVVIGSISVCQQKPNRSNGTDSTTALCSDVEDLATTAEPFGNSDSQSEMVSSDELTKIRPHFSTIDSENDSESNDTGGEQSWTTITISQSTDQSPREIPRAVADAEHTRFDRLRSDIVVHADTIGLSSKTWKSDDDVLLLVDSSETDNSFSAIKVSTPIFGHPNELDISQVISSIRGDGSSDCVVEAENASVEVEDDSEGEYVDVTGVDSDEQQQQVDDDGCCPPADSTPVPTSRHTDRQHVPVTPSKVSDSTLTTGRKTSSSSAKRLQLEFGDHVSANDISLSCPVTAKPVSLRDNKNVDGNDKVLTSTPVDVNDNHVPLPPLSVSSVEMVNNETALHIDSSREVRSDEIHVDSDPGDRDIPTTAHELNIPAHISDERHLSSTSKVNVEKSVVKSQCKRSSLQVESSSEQDVQCHTRRLRTTTPSGTEGDRSSHPSRRRHRATRVSGGRTSTKNTRQRSDLSMSPVDMVDDDRLLQVKSPPHEVQSDEVCMDSVPSDRDIPITDSATSVRQLDVAAHVADKHRRRVKHTSKVGGETSVVKRRRQHSPLPAESTYSHSEVKSSRRSRTRLSSGSKDYRSSRLSCGRLSANLGSRRASSKNKRQRANVDECSIITFDKFLVQQPVVHYPVLGSHCKPHRSTSVSSDDLEAFDW